jgi:8-oxo-dGTP pyrophosphatase MutT (NUDIX family)
MSFLDRIRACNNVQDFSAFRPFVVGDRRVGWIGEAFVQEIARFGDVFRVENGTVRLASGLDSYAARTEAVGTALRALKAEGHFPAWRGEAYPVGSGWGAAPLFQMERACVPRFGVAAYGVHINGYVRRPDGLHMWIARRARDKPTYPGQLDNMIAGGQPVGLGLMENVVKEAKEEAGVPAALARTARAVGAISYVHAAADGLKPDAMFVYDLELPAEFEPRNIDGEAESFMLLPVEEVMRITSDTAEFKFNCAVVNIDFFIRHGLISPEDPDYVEILRGMHR